MKMFKIVVMENENVKQENVLCESERMLTRQLNDKYDKENVLKIIDVTNKNVLCSLAENVFIEELYKTIINNDYFSKDTALFVTRVVQNALGINLEVE